MTRRARPSHAQHPLLRAWVLAGLILWQDTLETKGFYRLTLICSVSKRS